MAEFFDLDFLESSAVFEELEVVELVAGLLRVSNEAAADWIAECGAPDRDPIAAMILSNAAGFSGEKFLSHLLTDKKLTQIENRAQLAVAIFRQLLGAQMARSLRSLTHGA
jgi:hypothetical protein